MPKYIVYNSIDGEIKTIDNLSQGFEEEDGLLSEYTDSDNKKHIFLYTNSVISFVKSICNPNIFRSSDCVCMPYAEKDFSILKSNFRIVYFSSVIDDIISDRQNKNQLHDIFGFTYGVSLDSENKLSVSIDKSDLEYSMSKDVKDTIEIKDNKTNRVFSFHIYKQYKKAADFLVSYLSSLEYTSIRCF